MTKKKERTITINKSTMWMGATIIFATLFFISLFAGWNIGDTSTINTEVNVPVAAAPTDNAISVKLSGDEPVLGDKKAGITVVEFSDFQCPFCSRAYSGAMAGLKSSKIFLDGEVNLKFKHFPLDRIHPNARPAAIASVCAQEQGKFWEMHDKLFENQASLSQSSYIKWAGNLGLDIAKFTSCLSSSEAVAKVSADLSAATAAGGRGAPYFVVINNKNGKTASMSGARPFSDLETTINSVK